MEQEDVIYIPEHEPSIPVNPGVNVLRIRTQGEKILFTLKRSDVHNHLSKLEKELEISSASTMKEIIELLGYKEISRVSKQRQACMWGEFEICIDEVKNLGSFMEIEKITNEEPEVVQKQMAEIVSSLGLNMKDQVFRGYDILMLEKNG